MLPPNPPSGGEMRPPVIDAMLARRSVREGFDGRPVPAAVIQQIIRCGLAAPSSKNAQPWRLHVVMDQSLLELLAQAVQQAPGADEYVPHDPETVARGPHMCQPSASQPRCCAMFPPPYSLRTGACSARPDTLAKVSRPALAASLVGYGLEMIGIGACVENMWLAAEALGVQVAFMGDVVVADDEIRRRLRIAGDLVGVLALGYSAVSIPGRRQSLDESDPNHVIWHNAAAGWAAPFQGQLRAVREWSRWPGRRLRTW